MVRVPSASTRLGIDRFISTPSQWRNFKRLGLITSNAARTGSDPSRPGRSILKEKGVPLARLFSPEHGLSATEQDGRPIADSTDPLTGLPVSSLYGPRCEPAPELLADLDGLLFDLQDIGIRCYTFIWTLYHAMKACRAAGLPLLVLDRPNPLGGSPAEADGPLLDPVRYESFLGRTALPFRHGLTLGELARHWQREVFPDLALRVIELEGWKSRPAWPETGLPFHPPSPGIPEFASAFFYGATVFFEATNLSVGRGTPLAFQVVGAPWLHPADTIRHFLLAGPAGCRLEPVRFEPRDPPYAGQVCSGIRLVRTPREPFSPVATGLRLLASVLATHRHWFRWQPYPTAANPDGARHFELLTGTGGIREELEAGAGGLSPEQLSRWTDPGDWPVRASPALLYR